MSKGKKGWRQEKKWKRQSEQVQVSISEVLSSCLDNTSFNEEGRKLCVQGSVKRGVLFNLRDYMLTVNTKGTEYYSKIIMGSVAEGTALISSDSDIDILICQQFIAAKPKTNTYDLYLCMMKELSTPFGYTKLQLYLGERPAKYNIRVAPFCNSSHYQVIVDKNNHCFLQNTRMSVPDSYRLNIHGPAQTISAKGRSIDYVNAFPCIDLPHDIISWFKRKRRYGWPTKKSCQLFKKMGCFIVPVGHANSPENHLEWRISFSYQEQHLMLNLNPTQYKCYILLKFTRTHCLPSVSKEVISSYHCKTALFYTIENNSEAIWRPDNLAQCLFMCLQQLYDWVSQMNCPNYFIPEENMFETKLRDEQHANHVNQELHNILVNFPSILHELKVNIENYFGSERSITTVMVSVSNAAMMRDLLTKMIPFVSIGQPYLDLDIDKMIEFLLDFVDRMEKIKQALVRKKQVTEFCPFSEKTLKLLMNEQEKLVDDSFIDNLSPKRDIILKMFIYAEQYIFSKLASLYLAKLIKDDSLLNWCKVKFYEKHALRVDSSQYYLKMASVYFQKGKYLSCRHYLKKSMERSHTIFIACKCPDESLKKSPYQVFVQTRYNKDCLRKLNPDTSEDELQYQVPMCLIFDNLELTMIPTSLLYETYRLFGISRKTPKLKVFDYWFDWVVIDPKVYLYFLQYKNEESHGDITAVSDALEHLENTVIEGLIDGTVVHIETALNALGNIYITKGWYRLALHCFQRSLEIRPSCNAAKWHITLMLWCQ